MVIRANYPRSEFDANNDYAEDQAWRLLTYDWTDQNHDGKLWTDANGNGVVDHADLPTSSNIDGDPDHRLRASEMDKGEYVRFMYHRAGSNALMSFLRDPKRPDGRRRVPRPPAPREEPGHAGHPLRDRDRLLRELRLVVDRRTPASANGSFTATSRFRRARPYGMYEGAIVLTKGDDSIAVPVSVAVAATAAQDADGNMTGSVQFGGDDVADAQDRPPRTTTAPSSVPTTGAGAPSPVTGASSSSTCPRSRPRGRSGWLTRRGTGRRRTPTSTP